MMSLGDKSEFASEAARSGHAYTSINLTDCEEDDVSTDRTTRYSAQSPVKKLTFTI